MLSGFFSYRGFSSGLEVVERFARNVPITQQDIEYMQRAIELARRGFGRVNPNPAVGAVIVRDGRIIGEGWHRKFGELHAERNAFAACTEDPAGATIYVTLEPCCHYGKTPPCTEAVIENGIARVVIGSPDPNPLVAGKGVALLEEAGIEVEQGVLREECDELNRAFFHHVRTGLPFVVLKYAMTADGKIATRTGASKWITGEVARKRVHEDRNRYAAIMVGVGTVLADDPQLTCRIDDGVNPLRVICDSHLRTPLDSQIVTTANEVPTLIATCVSDPLRLKEYRERGCEVLVCGEGTVDLPALMANLGERGIDSVIVEGGATLNASVLKAGLVNFLQVYIAPKIFGSQQAPGPVGGMGVALPDEAYLFGAPHITPLGDDVLLECEVESCLQA